MIIHAIRSGVEIRPARRTLTRSLRSTAFRPGRAAVAFKYDDDEEEEEDEDEFGAPDPFDDDDEEGDPYEDEEEEGDEADDLDDDFIFDS